EDRNNEGDQHHREKGEAGLELHCWTSMTLTVEPSFKSLGRWMTTSSPGLSPLVTWANSFETYPTSTLRRDALLSLVTTNVWKPEAVLERASFGIVSALSAS